MKKTIFSAIAALFTFSLIFSSCKKNNDNPQPDEQELITTVKLTLTQGSDSSVYTYRVENGFNSTTPGTVMIDTLRLMPNTAYNAYVTVLNEKAADDETMDEILEEQNVHLFLFLSTPASGNGSVALTNGSKDHNGKPFNQTGILTSSGAGNGTLDVYLMHEPTDKTGTTPAASGGETDAHVTFPVHIR